MENNSEKTIEELIKEALKPELLQNMDKESLRHLDSIISGFAELRRLNNDNPSSFWMWTVLLMFLFGMPIGSSPMWGVESTNKEDK